MQNNIVQQWLEHYGTEVEVYFTIYEGACARCQQMYLTDGIGSQPVLFKLIEVIVTPSKAGVKIEEMYPSGGGHNLCCNRTLTVKPPNSQWDHTLKQFVLVRNTYGVTRKSKIIVTVKKIE
jgi:hypothetical protein